MNKMLTLLCTLLLLAGAPCAVAATSGDDAAGTETPASANLLFILDASGSMWGRVDGKPKIVVAKDVMSRLVRALPDDAKVGLTAYGHRRKGDCMDIESLVALGPLDRDAMIKQIEGLNAIGMTPLTASVKQAIEQLRQAEQSASVVLVSDGLESCGGDPCEAVKAARQSGVDFKLHVVGFDLGDADTQQLQCMADAGGGRFFSANNADELAGALDEAVQVEPEPGPVVEATGAIELTVTKNGEPIGAYTYVYKAGTEDEATREQAEKDGKARYELTAGDYDIKVRPMGVSAPDRLLEGITVSNGETTERNVDFSTGTVELTVTTNGKPLKARTYIQYADGHEEASRDGTDGEGLASYTIPVGEYRIQVRPDGISAPDQFIDDVTVEAGKTTTKRLEIPSGTVRIKVTADGKPLKARTYIQHADDHKEASRDSTDKGGIAGYTIPVGEYRIQVRPDGIEASDRFVEGVTVNAAETTEVSLDFPVE
ncbi:MAG: VWA domain-containing protein [Luteimonas sp.]|nr:VWA domain-containing protein [Luteimonas sp.]